MSPGQCSCPACGTTLRVRDRSFVGRQIDCPDCQAPLIIKVDDARQFVAERFQPQKVKSATTAAPAASRFGNGLGKQLAGLLHSPLVMAWALAIGVTAFLAILMLRPAVRFRQPAAGQTPPIVAAEPDTHHSAPEPEKNTDVASNPNVRSPAAIAENPAVPATNIAKPENPSLPLNSNSIPPVDPAALNPNPVAITPTAAQDSQTKPLVPIPAKIDIDGLLKQRLQGFATKTPVSRQKIIDQLEEMLGAPIHYDRAELGEKNLAHPVSLSLETTTVGGVLKALLDGAGWEFVIENDGLRLKPRQVAETAS